MEKVKGIDVSHYEPVIDWAKVKSQGYKFMFAKASQGIAPDAMFSEHWAGAKEAGILRGAYHLYDPRYQTINPKRQADFFFTQLKGDLGELPFVVDIEAYTSGPWAGWKNWYDYLEHLKTLAPEKEIMIYTGYYFWRDNGPSAADYARHQYFAQYPLWLAYYSKTHTPEEVGYIPLRGWNNWTFWQHSEAGLVDGITNDGGGRTYVDLNLFNGDDEYFNSRFGATPEPPQEEWRGFVLHIEGREEPIVGKVLV